MPTHHCQKALPARLLPIALRLAIITDSRMRNKFDMGRFLWFEAKSSGKEGKFSSYGWDSPYGITYWNGENAYIRFHDIRPVPGTAKITALQEDSQDRKILRSEATHLDNNTPTPIRRRREINETTTSTTSQSTTASRAMRAAVAIRQSLSYGSAISPISGETELAAEFEASWDQSSTTSSSSSTGYEDLGVYEFTIPPHHRMTVIRERRIVDVRSIITCEAEIDWQTTIWSHDDYMLNIYSRSILAMVMAGSSHGQVANCGNTSTGKPFEAAWRHQPAPDSDIHTICRDPITSSIDLDETSAIDTLAYEFKATPLSKVATTIEKPT